MNTPYLNTHKTCKTLSIIALVSGLTACGGADEMQDGPLASPDTTILVAENSSTKIAGAALAGYVANGLVWIDLRDNDTLDGTEPFAYTDSQGYFSYNPNTGIDYCAAQSAVLKQHCLDIGQSTGSVEIKVAKGTQLFSGTPFVSVLTQLVDLETARTHYPALIELGVKPSGNSIIWQEQVSQRQVVMSPLSTLAYYLPDEIQIAEVIQAFGMSTSFDLSNEETLSINFIEGLNNSNDPVSKELFVANSTINAIVDNFTLNFDAAFNSVDLGFDGFAINNADNVYEALAQVLVSAINADPAASPSTVDDKTPQHLAPYNALLNLDQLINAQDLMQANINDDYSGLELFNFPIQTPADSLIIAQENVDLSSAAIGVSQNDAATIALLVDFQSMQKFDANSLSRNSNILQQLALNEKMLNLAAQVFGETQIESALGSLMKNARNPITISGGTNLDTLGLKTALLQSGLNPDETVDAASDDEFLLSDVDTLSIPGSYLSLSGVQDSNEQGQLVVYFDGAGGDTSGSITMCVAYNNPSDPSDNISGQRFTGSWGYIGDSGNRLSLLAEGFRVQMNILGETLGSEIPLEQQIPSLQRNPNELYGKLGFSLNDDRGSWHSDQASMSGDFGFRAIESIPNTDSQCADALSLSF
jgi:hypothetical protein